MTIFSLFKRVIRVSRIERHTITAIVTAAVIVAAAQIADSVLFGRVIDALARHNEFARLLVVWVAVGTVNVIFSIGLTIMADRFSHRHRVRNLNDAFESSILQSARSFFQLGTGKTVRTILSGNDQVFWVTVVFFMANITALAAIAIVVPLAFVIQPYLACVLLIVAAVYGASSVFIVRTTHTKQEKVDQFNQDVAARLLDVLGNIAVVHSFNRVKQEADSFRALTHRALRQQYPVLNWWGAFNLVTRFSSMISMLVIVAVGAELVHRGLTSAGAVVTFVGFSNLLIFRLDQLSNAFNRVASQAPTLQNLFRLIDTQGAATNQYVDTSVARSEVAKNALVTFKNVTFHYENDKQGVHQISFAAQPGQTVALVGASGSGKTTTLALLQRVLRPQEGQIEINGVDIQTMSAAEISVAIATVFQEPGLFNRSIYDNIEVGCPGASQVEVEAAAIQADAHDFISSRPEGYSFIVGERGLALSGGERQRIALARAILKNAPILILDEATSALDNESERRIQRATAEMRRGKTTFIVAHRLSTIVSADQILVYSNGRIIEQGAFEDLRNSDGHFARLLKAGEIAQASVESRVPFLQSTCRLN